MKRLDVRELEILQDEVWHRLTVANLNGSLEKILRKIGWTDLLGENDINPPYPDGKIVVIGESEVKVQILIAIAEQFGISRDRLEFCLDYDKAKTYNYDKLYFEPKYRAVLFGPLPHSTSGKEDFSSVITKMENTVGYPQIIRISESDSGHLKITKSSFRKAIENLMTKEEINGKAG